MIGTITPFIKETDNPHFNFNLNKNKRRIMKGGRIFVIFNKDFVYLGSFLCFRLLLFFLNLFSYSFLHLPCSFFSIPSFTLLFPCLLLLSLLIIYLFDENNNPVPFQSRNLV